MVTDQLALHKSFLLCLQTFDRYLWLSLDLD